MSISAAFLHDQIISVSMATNNKSKSWHQLCRFWVTPNIYTKIMKIPDIAWPTFFDSYRESMFNIIKTYKPRFIANSSSCTTTDCLYF